MEIYVKCNRKDFGPYSLEQLRELVEDGTFLPHDSATVGKSGEWTLIKKIPGFQVEGEPTPETVALAELSCPYCRGHVASSELRSCPTCQSPHHEECWRENGGCTVYGCSQAPADGEPIRIGPADWSDEQEESTPATSNTEPEPRPPQAIEEGGIPWKSIGIAALLVAGGIWWLFGDRAEDERRELAERAAEAERVEAEVERRERELAERAAEAERVEAEVERRERELAERIVEAENIQRAINALPPILVVSIPGNNAGAQLGYAIGSILGTYHYEVWVDNNKIGIINSANNMGRFNVEPGFQKVSVFHVGSSLLGLGSTRKLIHQQNIFLKPGDNVLVSPTF